MSNFIDVTFDADLDAVTHRALPQSFGTPPEDETEFAGLDFFGESDVLDPLIIFTNIPGPPGASGVPGESFELPLGDDPDTAGSGPWTTGAVTLTPLTSVGHAISLINHKLALAATEAEIVAIQAEIANFSQFAVDILLGDEIGTDDVSIWNGGAVTLTPGMTAGEALAKLNHFLAGGLGAQDGFHLPLGSVSAFGDGSWTPGAVALTDNTLVSDAVDQLNEVLSKLLPSQPPNFPNGALSIANPTGSSPRLASGVTDNSGTSTLLAGDAVTRTTANASTNLFNDVGPGDSGTLTVLLNGAGDGSHILTGTADNGAYGTLIISDQKDFPLTTPGFWKSIDVQASNVLTLSGVNKLKITHTGAGSTADVYLVRDTMTAAPAVSGGAVAEATAGVYAYSSSIPHYGTGGQLHVDASISNLSGETYYGGADPLVISGTNSIISTNTLGYAALGIVTPIARQITVATAISQQTINVDGNVHNSGVIQGLAKNVNGSSVTTTLSTKTVLVKRGSAGARIDENSIAVSGLGSTPNASNAIRKGGFAAVDKPTGSGVAWDSTAALPNTESSVVGGVLKYDLTDYTTGFLPIGPNLNIVGRQGSQFATFSFDRTAVSVFHINVTGSYQACYIKLPGVTDDPTICPNAVNGWLDATKAYTGAGVPGNASDPTAGCAVGAVMSGSGSFQITFGTETSSHATGNEILVRFKMANGHSITALSFSN